MQANNLHYMGLFKKINMNHRFLKIAVIFEVITVGIAHRNYSLRFIHSDMNRDKVYFEYHFQKKRSSGVDVSGIYDYT